MTTAIWIAAGFSIAAAVFQLSSNAIAVIRCRRGRLTTAMIRNGPSVSLVRPVCGIENHVEETLRSGFRLQYPRYELIFCAATANDPAVPLVQEMIASNPRVPARLLIGNEMISDNPKLNNVCK